MSCGMHKQFVDDTIQELVKKGSLVEWQGPRPPVVINGMGVVENRTVLHCPEIWGCEGGFAFVRAQCSHDVNDGALG